VGNGQAWSKVGKQRALGFALLAACAVTAFAASAQTQELLWQSRNNSRAELSAEFGNFYAALLAFESRGGTIPTRVYTDVEGKLVSDIAKAEGLWDGTYFPQELNHVLCKLNPTICRAVSPAASGQGANYVWSNSKGSEIFLPNIEFEQTIFPRAFSKKKGDSLARIVVKDRQGCAALDEKCLRYVTNLNRANPDFASSEFEGEILVPTKIYRARLNLNVPRQVDASKTPIPSNAQASPNLSRPLGKAEWVGSAADIQKGYESFKDSLVPAAKIESQATGANDGSSITGSITRIRTLVSVPDHVQLVQSAPVGILDRHVFQSHCDFTSTLTIITSGADGIASLDRSDQVFRLNRAPGAADPPDCLSSPLRKGLKGDDHGTHIVGLLNGWRTSLLGSEAASKLKVFAFELPHVSLPEATQVAALADTINASFRNAEIFVFNMSLQYPFTAADGQNDPVEELLRSVSETSTTLFVAAAGNDGKDIGFSAPCAVRPGCFRLGDVLSVVALNLDDAAPQVIPESNRGEAFDIAAPGLDIESTISDNGLGTMSGTSQATAIVSAAAALLYSKRRELNPWQVRNRFIYTADQLSSLQGKVFGGRLNVKRALDFDLATIVLDNDATSALGEALPTKLQGHLIETPGNCIAFTDIDRNAAVSVQSSQIKRLIAIGDIADNVYRIFLSGSVHCERQLEQARDLQKFNVTPVDPNASIRLKYTKLDGTPTVQKIPIKFVKDYIAELRDQE
jgi:subtilisin family serine protease